MLNRHNYLIFDNDRACPLCGSYKRIVLSQKMQFKLDCTTVICTDCGFCFVSPAPTKKAYDNFYREAYATFYKKIHRDADTLTIPENVQEKIRLDLIDGHKKIAGSAVLEIGPGNGRFISLTSRRGGKCSAVEPSEEFRKKLKSKGIDVIGDFLEHTPMIKQYDIICLFQVLEHFHDPVEAVKKIRGLLSQDGIVVIDVPNILRPYRNLDRYFLRYVHLSYFSPRTLTNLLVMNGFELLHLDTGRETDIYTAWSIFVIAKKNNGNKVMHQRQEPDNWQDMLAHLKKYKRKYWYVDAPRIHLYLIKRAIRRYLSRSPIGEGYRKLKKVLVK